MRALAPSEVSAISGGDSVTESEANDAIGRVAGEVWHVVSSREFIVGMMFGGGGMLAGMAIHQYLYHQ